jgi:hypothetical protein
MVRSQEYLSNLSIRPDIRLLTNTKAVIMELLYGNNSKTDTQYYIPVTTTNSDQILRIKITYLLLNNFFYLFNFMPWNFLLKIFKISATRII